MRQFRTTVLVLVAGVTVSALLSWLIYQKVMRPARVREDAFTAYLDGQLKPDDRGVITLPAEWAMASEDGSLYVTREPTGTRWGLFVLEKGSRGSLRGYAFCDHPAAARVATDVELNYPTGQANAPGPATQPGGETVILKIKRVVNPNCFEVVKEAALRTSR